MTKYPEPKHRRSGCKVSWNYYETLAEAEAAADVAKAEAIELEKLGYDWGYQSPGFIRLQESNGFYPGLYKVCIP
jgi:hypothetical protein